MGNCERCDALVKAIGDISKYVLSSSLMSPGCSRRLLEMCGNALLCRSSRSQRAVEATERAMMALNSYRQRVEQLESALARLLARLKRIDPSLHAADLIEEAERILDAKVPPGDEKD